MKRRSLTLLTVAAVAGTAGIGSALWRHRVSQPSADAQKLWAMRFEQPSGKELVMADFKGQPLLLNFWATWCPPCITEMPLLDRFEQEHRQRGWRVVGLAIDRPAAVSEFLIRNPIGFAIALAGAEGVSLTRSLGNQGGGLPFSVVFDRQGRIARTKLGSVHEKELAAWAAAMG